METVLAMILGLLQLATLLVLFLLLRRSTGEPAGVRLRFESLERGQERVERALREELHRGLSSFANTFLTAMQTMGAQQASQLEGVTAELRRLVETNEQKLERVRQTVDGRLEALQRESAKKLDEMRATVDEKLQGTLEKRLGESFKLVSDRLEQVHRGLGEMQTLAVGVGDLKKVLGNVKTRGTWGEAQLGTLLEQVLTPGQWAQNVATGPRDSERVEFAIKLPGRDEEDYVWLPIDAKFPLEDYARLVAAEEVVDTEAAASARTALEARLRGFAAEISKKYLNPPKTTEYAIMYLPTEGLFAEAVRRPALIERLRNDYRVMIAGPTTIDMLLVNLHFGFRSLEVQRRSAGVLSLLGAVKTEFGKFGKSLDGVRKKLEQATKQMDEAGVRTRQIERKLKEVVELPVGEAQSLLPESIDELELEEADPDAA
jgi:DNA recombination protein RmuC